MTGATGQNFLMIKQNSVEFICVRKFKKDAYMATHAAILHEFGLPGSRVTLITGLANLCVRTDISK